MNVPTVVSIGHARREVRDEEDKKVNDIYDSVNDVYKIPIITRFPSDLVNQLKKKKPKRKRIHRSCDFCPVIP